MYHKLFRQILLKFDITDFDRKLSGNFDFQPHLFIIKPTVYRAMNWFTDLKTMHPVVLVY
jgi:hypothetical protein